MIMDQVHGGKRKIVSNFDISESSYPRSYLAVPAISLTYMLVFGYRKQSTDDLINF